LPSNSFAIPVSSHRRQMRAEPSTVRASRYLTPTSVSWIGRQSAAVGAVEKVGAGRIDEGPKAALSPGEVRGRRRIRLRGGGYGRRFASAGRDRRRLFSSSGGDCSTFVGPQDASAKPAGRWAISAMALSPFPLVHSAGQSRERRSKARTNELVALTTPPFGGSTLNEPRQRPVLPL